MCGNVLIQKRFMKICGFSLLIAIMVFASTVLANENENTSQRNPKITDNPEPVTNDNTHLIPKTEFEGPVLEFDFLSLHIGVAEYEEGPTGCTVFYFPNTAKSVVDIRGGMPGTLQGIAAADGGGVSAVCFAGGSLYGLEAATGVSAEIFAQSGYAGVHGVRGAIIYDFFRANWIYPDKTLGRAALRAAKPNIFPLGARGAGRSATCGKWLLKPFEWERAGQGGAFHQVGPTKVAVFSVVNSLGAIMDRQGNVVRGHYNPETGKRHTLTDALNLPPSDDDANPSVGNTTLTLVVTNQKISMEELRQLAKHVHSSMTRAIYPFHTSVDGDVLYAVTTHEVDNPDINHFRLSHIASELAWDAVLNCFEKDDPEKP